MAANIFDKFDQEVNLDEIEKQKKEAAENSFEEVPAGGYFAKIESMELGLTKDGKRPMFKVRMRLTDGAGKTEKEFLAKYTRKKPCIFMNRVIFGTKNDGAMIQSVETWLNKLDALDQPVVFTGYGDFADQILDCAEACENFELEIDYDPKAFNSITVKDVFDA